MLESRSSPVAPRAPRRPRLALSHRGCTTDRLKRQEGRGLCCDYVASSMVSYPLWQSPAATKPLSTSTKDSSQALRMACRSAVSDAAAALNEPGLRDGHKSFYIMTLIG